MEGEESAEKKRRELERRVLEKVGLVISSIDNAKHIDQVIAALYSIAACLFPLQPNSLSGSIDEQYRDELLDVEVPSGDEKKEWWNVFYTGSAFRAFSRVLLYDVASNWLPCLPASARKHVYDAFFTDGCATEIVQLVIPCLQHSEAGHYDASAVCLNAERLLVLCLLENDLVLQMAREFAFGCQFEYLSHEQLKLAVSRASQLITSIPDKARRGASTSLSPHVFFKRLTSQLLRGAEELDLKLVNNSSVSNENHIDGTILFVGEAFTRICRRGSADVLLSEVIPLVLGHVRSVMSISDLAVKETFESKPGFRFWLKIMEAVTDSYSLERIAEELLRQLALQNLNEIEGYWILWILFGRIYKQNTSVRFAFVDKFLLWKVFPICCLRWIIHFAVVECTPDSALPKSYNAHTLSETVHRLVVTWSRKEFLQSSPTEQQAYVTAALGLCLEKMAKEDLDATKDVLHLILQGISCRLENPAYLIRKMASAIALVFSKIIDPKNPLYLDDSCREETINWDFGLTTPRKDTVTATVLGDENTHERENFSTQISGKEIQQRGDKGVGNISKSRMAKESVLNLIDPDEIIDPANLNYEHSFDDDDESDNASEASETSSDSSLQPYDLTDDDADLKRKFSQLVDVVGALRKSDDAESVENALDVAEKFIRASPDELKYIAGDLVKALVQVRCPEFTVEGDEESAEEKRQKALVALIVACPFEALDSLNKLLYSPNLDISQRIMILDVMTDAAQELASARILKSGHKPTALISSISDQPWFIPINIGPQGAGPWREIPTGTPLNWSYSYERKLPSKAGQIKRGKTRRWNLRAPLLDNQLERSQNRFPLYAAAFMLPSMQGFDKKRHGVDLLGRDFIVLGKLMYMLGVCMKCAAMHPEASVLASPLLDMLRCREISHHAEAYVRRSVLFAASCVLLALHPSYVASAVVEGSIEISEGLDWVRTWALQVAESDTDGECHKLAMGCLQLHAEMALQASRALESSKDASTAKSISLLPSMSTRSIKIPYLNS